MKEIRKQSFNGKEMTYYILTPLKKETSLIYVPVDNDLLTGRMRHVLKEEDVRKAIRRMPQGDLIWSDDEQERKQQFRDVLISGDIDQMMRLLKTLYQHRIRQQEIGKKMHQSDENAYRDAAELIFEEFTYVLKTDRSEIEEMIESSFSLNAEEENA